MTLLDIPNVAFRQLAASLSTDLVPSSPRTFELMLEEDGLPVRISLHPDQQRVIMQVYVADVSTLVGPLRKAIMPSLLFLNQAAIEGRSFFIGLDSRDFVCVTRIQPLDKSQGDEFFDDLDYLLHQADEIRTLVESLALQNAEMEFDAVPDPEAVAEALRALEAGDFEEEDESEEEPVTTSAN